MTVFYNDTITNIIKTHISTMAQSYSALKFAKVKEYDPKTARIKVHFFNPVTKDFDLVSNWMAYATAVNGRGSDSEAGDGNLWGNVHGPNINEQVLLIPPDGDHNNAIIVGSIFTDKRPPPALNGDYTLSGEWLYKHKTGSYLKYTNDGDLFIKATRDLRVIIDGKADITVLGNTTINVGGDTVLNADGNLTATVGGNTTVNADGPLTANVGGNATINSVGDISVNTDGSLTVNAGGSMNASVSGFANIQSQGGMFLQSDTNIAVLSRGILTLQGNLGVILASETSVFAVAPIAPISETTAEIVPPLPPLVFTPPNVQAPPKPAKAIDTDTDAPAGAVPTPPASTPPAAAENLQVSNIGPDSATIDFVDPGNA